VPLEEPEGRPVRAAAELVLVDERGQDHLGQLREGRRLGDGREMALALDQEAVDAEDVADVDGAVATVAPRQPVTELVDGEAQVLDLVEAESQTAGQAGGGHPRQPQELGHRRDGESHLICRGHVMLLPRRTPPTNPVSSGRPDGHLACR
jgi:hypothetical protein